DPLPEGVRAEEDTPAVFDELLQELPARCLALNEERPGDPAILSQPRRQLPEGAVGGKQDEDTPIGHLRHLGDDAKGGRTVLLLPRRRWNVVREGKNRLALEVEGGGIHRLVHAQITDEAES